MFRSVIYRKHFCRRSGVTTLWPGSYYSSDQAKVIYLLVKGMWLNGATWFNCYSILHIDITVYYLLFCVLFAVSCTPAGGAMQQIKSLDLWLEFPDIIFDICLYFSTRSITTVTSGNKPPPTHGKLLDQSIRWFPLF